MWLNPQYCQFAIDFSHLRHLNYWCANSTCEAEQQINLSESQRWEKWWKIIYLTCDLWAGLMEESRTADAEQQTHSACKGQGPLSFSCTLITKFAKFPQLWCTLSKLYPADSCYQTKHISVWKKKKKNTVIPGTARLRPTMLHDMLIYSSGTRQTKANKRRAVGVLWWSKRRANRKQQSPMGRGNSPLLVHMQSVRTRLAFYPALTGQTCARRPSARPISAADITGRNYSHKSNTDPFGSISAKLLDCGPKNISTIIFKLWDTSQ